MSNFILAGLYTEGTTDVRFLSSVIERTLEDVAFECTGAIETMLEVIKINKSGLSFSEQVLEASKVSFNKYGTLLLFVHTDADSETDDLILNTKIIPAHKLISEEDDCCKHIIPIVPIQMTESWMIADKKLLKSEIGIDKTDTELGIHLNPEKIKNPKGLIEDIIRVSKEDITKRKRRKGLEISDLYQIIGKQVELIELQKLSSYSKFKDSLISKLKELNYYH